MSRGFLRICHNTELAEISITFLWFDSPQASGYFPARRSYIFRKITSKEKILAKKIWVTDTRLRVSWPSKWAKMGKIESPRHIQRVSKATYLSYQPVTHPNSTYTNLQFQRWKWHYSTGIHLAVALESNGFFNTLGYGAYPNRIFWRIFVSKSWS